MSKKPNKKVNLKAFLSEVEGNINEGLKETLEWVAEETTPILEWKLIQTIDETTNTPVSFVVFVTEENQITLPLTNDNVSDLIKTMIQSTPDLSPDSVPYVKDKRNFWRKYKSQVIWFSAFIGLFIAASLYALILQLINPS